MQFHSTATPETIQLDATPRFQLRVRSFAIVAFLVASASMSVPSALAASNDQEPQWSNGPRSCTLATLQGRYLFAESGVLVPPAFGVAKPTQASDAGVHMFNGDGTGTDTVTLRIGDNIVVQRGGGSFAYTVNADCTGTLTVPNGPTFDIFIAPDGSEFASIATAPAGNYATSIIRRVSRR
jgi:hypothetical protein